MRGHSLPGYCICTAGDPCDYHAATCVVCPVRCKGHPAAPILRMRPVYSDGVVGQVRRGATEEEITAKVDHENGRGLTFRLVDADDDAAIGSMVRYQRSK